MIEVMHSSKPNKKQLSSLTRKRIRITNLSFFLYVFPALFSFVLFKWWPIIYSFALSYMKWNFVGAKHWVGLQNYARLFTHPHFHQAFVNTFIYIVALFPFFVVLPLLFALLLSYIRNKSIQGLYRALLFIPTILAFSIVCLVWMWMYNPQFGLFNNLLGLVGGKSISWLSDENYAIVSIVIVTGWKILGQNLILYAAGLMMISNDYIEAATIDGASQWKIFWKIKWPLLAPTTIYNVITAVN